MIIMAAIRHFCALLLLAGLALLALRGVASHAQDTTPMPTLDPFEAAVQGTLTALAPTATATLDPFEAAVQGTLTALAPTPTLAPLPGPAGSTGRLTTQLITHDGRLRLRYPAGWHATFALDTGLVLSSSIAAMFQLAPGDVRVQLAFFTPTEWPTAYSDLRLSEEAIRDLTLQTTFEDTIFPVFDGQPGVIVRHIRAASATLVLIRQAENGDVFWLSAEVAPGELPSQEPVLFDIFLAFGGSASGDFAQFFSHDLPAGAAPSLLVPEAGDVCAASSGALVQGIQTPADTPYVPVTTSFGRGADAGLTGGGWQPVPGTTVALQVISPPAALGPVHLAVIVVGFEFVRYDDVAVATGASLLYTFDDRFAPYGYAVWLENGWSPDPTATLFMTVRCVASDTILAATPTPIPTRLPTRFPTATPAVICQILATQGVNLRTGPGTDTPLTGRLAAGEQRFVDGYAVDAGGVLWWRLLDGTWVRADLVSAQPSCANLPPLPAR
jgi:hypothetical protein